MHIQMHSLVVINYYKLNGLIHKRGHVNSSGDWWYPVPVPVTTSGKHMVTGNIQLESIDDLCFDVHSTHSPPLAPCSA